MKSRICCVCALFLAAVFSFAADCSSQPKPAAADSPSRLLILPAPPADQSAEHKAELELVLHAQRGASAAELARLRREFKLGLAAFGPVLGPWFRRDKLPATQQLVARAVEIADKLCIQLKGFYRRARPPAGNPAIKPLDVKHFDHQSYPSWHATMGMLHALLLAELVPAQREALIGRGQEIGWDRVIAGMHHPSDIAAGRMLAQLVFRSLMRKPDFIHLLAEAKVEIRAAVSRRHRPG